MKELGLQELLRYALAGAAGLVALLLTYPYARESVSKVQGIGEASLVVGAVLLVGSLVYSLHRALVFPLLSRLAIGFLAVCRTLPRDRDLLIPYRPTKLEVELDLWRWRHNPSIQKELSHLAEWGAQVHFLYCTTWAIQIAIWFGGLGGREDPIIWWKLFLLSVLTLVAGFVSNLRLLFLLNKVRTRPPGNPQFE